MLVLVATRSSGGLVLVPGGNAIHRGLRGANRSHPNEDKHKAQYISLKAKKGKKKELSMYRLREMDVNDKVCEQVSMTMLSKVYPKDVIERCVHQSEPWSTKARRVRLSTALALVMFVIAMALWSRLNQCQVWQKLVGKLSDLHPGEPERRLVASGLSGRRQALGRQGLQTLMRV